MCKHTETLAHVCVCVCARDCNNASDKGGKESKEEIQPQLFPLGLVVMATEAFSYERGTTRKRERDGQTEGEKEDGGGGQERKYCGGRSKRDGMCSQRIGEKPQLQDRNRICTQQLSAAIPD